MKVASKVFRWLSLAASIYHLFNYLFISLPTILLVYLPSIIMMDIIMLPLILVPFIYIPYVVLTLVPIVMILSGTIISLIAVVKSACNKPSLGSGIWFLALSMPFGGTPFFNGILLIVWSALRKRIKEKEDGIIE